MRLISMMVEVLNVPVVSEFPNVLDVPNDLSDLNVSDDLNNSNFILLAQPLNP